MYNPFAGTSLPSDCNSKLYEITLVSEDCIELESTCRSPQPSFPIHLHRHCCWGCLLALLLAIAIIDALHGIIPDWANFALAMGGLMRSGLGSGPAFHEAAIAAVIVSVSMLTFREAFARVRGCPGLGMGDIKFLAAAALWTELAGWPTLLLIASMSGVLFLIVRSLAGHEVTKHTRLAFGPHLAAGMAFVGLFGSLN